jgi:hypothetical protein
VTEPPRQTIRDLVAARSEETETSSRVELLQLETCLQDTGPVVAWLHGPAGVGKTRLLNEFGRRTEDAGANIVRIDCNAVEPTASGLLGALGELLAVPVGDVSEAASADLPIPGCVGCSSRHSMPARASCSSAANLRQPAG